MGGQVRAIGGQVICFQPGLCCLCSLKCVCLRNVAQQWCAAGSFARLSRVCGEQQLLQSSPAVATRVVSLLLEGLEAARPRPHRVVPLGTQRAAAQAITRAYRPGCGYLRGLVMSAACHL